MINVKINMRDMAQIERAVTRLTGDRAGAARFRRDLTAAVQKEAVKAAPRIMAEVIGEKLKAREAGWVNDPVRDKAVLVQAKTGCVLLDDKGKPILRPRIAYRKTPNIDLGIFIDHLKRPEVENFVPYMYLDDGGNVTVGIGILLKSAQAAISLPFVKKGTNKRPHPAHVEKDYNRVKSAPAGMKWPRYEIFSSIVISEAEATSRTLTFINNIFVEINVVFPDFDTYPTKAKMGILDMFYSLGTTKILADWPLFRAAVKRRDWKTAARQSIRNNVSTERTQAVATWFEESVPNTTFFIDSICSKPLSTL